MYVYEKMTSDVKTLKSSDTVNAALDLMKENNFHRVPIVENDVLVGLVTQGVIESATPSKATSLSIFELNYLLSKTTLKDIMIKDVVTISPNALLEDAAVLMRSKNIGALCVLDKGKLVGIITQKDIFDAFIDLLGYYQPGKRFLIEVEHDKVGVLKDITTCFANEDVWIESISVYHKDHQIYIQVQANDVNNIMEGKLTAAGYVVKEIIELNH